MDKKSSLLAFMLGMAVGSVITWQVIKDRYERRIEEDRKSLEEMYTAKKAAIIDAEKVAEEEPEKKKEESPAPDPKEIAERAKDKPSMDEYIQRLQGEGYTDYTRKGRPEETPKPDYTETPYVISPEEFGELDGYEKISLTYYADGVLADEDDEPVDDIEEIVGDGLEHFGEYGEEDSVFVRSDARKCDYEILRDLREFSDVVGAFPPRH